MPRTKPISSSPAAKSARAAVRSFAVRHGACTGYGCRLDELPDPGDVAPLLAAMSAEDWAALHAAPYDSTAPDSFKQAAGYVTGAAQALLNHVQAVEAARTRRAVRAGCKAFTRSIGAYAASRLRAAPLSSPYLPEPESEPRDIALAELGEAPRRAPPPLRLRILTRFVLTAAPPAPPAAHFHAGVIT